MINGPYQGQGESALPALPPTHSNTTEQKENPPKYVTERSRIKGIRPDDILYCRVQNEKYIKTQKTEYLVATLVAKVGDHNRQTKIMRRNWAALKILMHLHLP